MHLQFAVQVALHKLLDAAGREIQLLWSILDRIFLQQDQTQRRTVFRLQSKELENTQVVIVVDVNVHEQHLTCETFTSQCQSITV